MLSLALAGLITMVSHRAPILQVDRAAKVVSLHDPVCLIPNGQQIDVADLPRSVLRTDWMRRVKGSLPISLVSIPATHDAGTALGELGSTRCQVLTIGAQLAVGIRGFDIRLRLVGDTFQIYHSEESQKLKFADVLKSMSDFLAAHPSEFIVMRVKEENTPVNATESFEAAFARHIAPYSNLFYKATSRTEIPTVLKMRGKILVLDNFGKLPDAVDYPNTSMSIQDDYDTSDMDKKLHEILAKFHDAQTQTDGSVWNINYTSSCTLQVDQLANAKAVNSHVLEFLTGKKGNLGLVLMNFPSVDAIEKIIASNF